MYLFVHYSLISSVTPICPPGSPHTSTRAVLVAHERGACVRVYRWQFASTQGGCNHAHIQWTLYRSRSKRIICWLDVGTTTRQTHSIYTKGKAYGYRWWVIPPSCMDYTKNFCAIYAKMSGPRNSRIL